MSRGSVTVLALAVLCAGAAGAEEPAQRQTLVTASWAPGTGAGRLSEAVSRGAVVIQVVGPDRALLAWPDGSARPDWIRPRVPGEPVRGLAFRLAKHGVDLEQRGRWRVGVLPRGEDEVSGTITSAGGSVVWVATRGPVVEIGVEASAEVVLTALDSVAGAAGFVVWAEPAPRPVLLNGRSVWRCQSGLPGGTPIHDRGLLGQGQIIAIMDTGLDVDHCFFRDDDVGLPALNGDRGVLTSPAHRKVVAANFWWPGDWPDPGPFSWDTNGHGTHVAGSAAGDGGRRGLHDGDDGMAPAARLVIQDGGAAIDDCGDLPGLGCPMRPLEPMLEQAWRQGARVHSNSWGDEENILPFNTYTERTADLDRFVWNHPEMVVLAAAGNGGGFGSGSVISPSTGKNVISVGAVGPVGTDPLCPAGFSSLGWTHDDRVKPDLLAPGSGVVSAASDGDLGSLNCDVFAASGTSMAAPTAAGLAALVRQYFAEGWHLHGRREPQHGFDASAALIKASLIASAVDLTELGCPTVDPAPSPAQGWGLIQLDRALWFEGDDHRLLAFDRRAEVHESGLETVERRIRVGGGEELVVVLVWTDAPSNSAAEVNLVQDLDLVVAGPGGSFRGNVLSSGRSVAGGEPDRRNPVEVVRVADPAPGTWSVRVRAHNTPLGSQDFALVIVGDVVDGQAPRDPGSAGRSPGREPGGVRFR